MSFDVGYENIAVSDIKRVSEWQFIGQKKLAIIKAKI